MLSYWGTKKMKYFEKVSSFIDAGRYKKIITGIASSTKAVSGLSDDLARVTKNFSTTTGKTRQQFLKNRILAKQALKVEKSKLSTLHNDFKHLSRKYNILEATPGDQVYQQDLKYIRRTIK